MDVGDSGPQASARPWTWLVDGHRWPRDRPRFSRLCAVALRWVANSLLLFAGFHLVGAVIVLASAYALGLRRLLQQDDAASPAPTNSAGARSI